MDLVRYQILRLWDYKLTILCIVISAVCLWGACYWNALSHVGTLDFMQYWSAQQLITQGLNPYDPESLHDIQQRLWPKKLEIPIIMYCPPWVLSLLLPLKFFSDFTIAAASWNFISCLFLLFAIVFLKNCLETTTSKGPGFHLLIISLTFTPIYTLLYYGQISHLLLIGLLPSFLFLNNSSKWKEVIIGFGLAITTIKPHALYLVYLLLLIIFFRRRQYLIGVSFVVTLVLMSIIPYLIDSQIYSWYAHFIEQPPINWKTPTLSYWLQILTGMNSLAIRLVPGVVSVACLMVVVGFKGGGFSTQATLAMVLPFSLVTAPYGWLFDQVLLLPSVVYILYQFRNKTWKLLLLANLLMFLMPRSLGQEYYIWYPIFIGSLIFAYSFKGNIWTTGCSENNGLLKPVSSE